MILKILNTGALWYNINNSCVYWNLQDGLTQKKLGNIKLRNVIIYNRGKSRLSVPFRDAPVLNTGQYDNYVDVHVN